MVRHALVAILIAAPGLARAGGLALGGSVVADDGAAAVVLNPAGLARRDAVRAQLGLVVHDDHARWNPVGTGPVIEDRGASAIFPVLAAAGAAGPVVLGASLIEDEVLSRRFAAPTAGQPTDDVERLYPHRYAGLAGEHHRRTLALGAAWRANEWLAIGGSVTLSRVSLDETRRIWAGFDGRTAEEVPGSADRDLEVRVAGADAFVPGGALGVLVAPIDVPIEVAASIAWADRARIAGDATMTDGAPGAGPGVTVSSPSAAVTLESPLIARLGARWLAERWTAELGGELSVYPGGDAPAWTVDGVTVVDDLSGVTAPLDPLASRFTRRTHGGGRAAVDVETIPGFVWLGAAWAFTTAATPDALHTGAAGELAHHTLALSAEISTDGVTVTLGVARRFTALYAGPSDLTIDNPFTGTASAGDGSHDQTRDTIALTVEAEL